MSLRQLKRRYYEVYGHVDATNNTLPEFVKFLVFDTDKASVIDESTTLEAFNPFAGGDGKGKRFEINFDSNEVVGVSAENCKDLILNPENEKTFDGWVPLSNKTIINQLNDLKSGAGQIRLFGRVAFFFNAEKIRAAIEKAINVIQLVDMANEHFAPLDDGSFDIDINIVASIAGGTGSGMFMDTAIACRDILKNGSNHINGRIRGFFVLPEIFLKSGLPGNFNRVLPNAAGALKEIDLFMEFYDKTQMETLQGQGNFSMATNIWSPQRSPINEVEGAEELTIRYLGQTTSRISGKPFDEVYLIGQSNENGATFNKVKDLCEVVAKGLFANSISLSTKLQTLDDNFKSSSLPFKGKESWVRSIGVSELVYNSYEVRKQLALSAIDQSLRLALADELDMLNIQQLAAKFMLDSNLLEQGDKQHLVNSIVHGIQLPVMELNEEDYPVLNNRLAEKRALLKKNYAAMSSMSATLVSGAIDNLSAIKKGLSVHGKANAEIRVLEQAVLQINASIEELRADSIVNTENLAALEKQRTEIEGEISEFLSMNVVMRMLKKSELNELVNVWSENARETLEEELAMEARSLGLDVLSKLQKQIERMKEQDQLEVNWLRSLQGGLQKEMERRSYGSIADEYPNPFTINLHVDEMRQVVDLTGEENWDQDDFIDCATRKCQVALDSNGSTISELWDSTSEELTDYVIGRGLKMIAEVKDDRLEMILNQELEEAQNARLAKETALGKRLLQLIERSSPVLNYYLPDVLNKDGLNLKNSLKSYFMVCVPSEDLEKGFKKVLDKLNDKGFIIDVFSTSNQKDRVTIFRRQIAAPAFAIAGARNYIHEYNKRHTKDLKTGELFHVNYNWFRAMKQVNFNLLEGTSESGTNRQKLFTWAFLMGWIAWEQDHWRIQTLNLKETWTLRRDQLFTKLMMEEDYGKELEQFMQQKQSSLFELKDAFYECVDISGMIPDFTKYLKHPKINPYEGSVTATNKFGSSYDRVQGGPAARIQLQTELEALKEIAEEVKRW